MDIVPYVIAGVVPFIASGLISIALTYRAELKRSARIFRSKLSGRKGIDEKSLTISLAYVTSADVSKQWWDQQFAKLQISAQQKPVSRDEVLNYIRSKVGVASNHIMTRRTGGPCENCEYHEYVEPWRYAGRLANVRECRECEARRRGYELSLVARDLAERSAKLPELLKSEKFISTGA